MVPYLSQYFSKITMISLALQSLFHKEIIRTEFMIINAKCKVHVAQNICHTLSSLLSSIKSEVSSFSFDFGAFVPKLPFIVSLPSSMSPIWGIIWRKQRSTPRSVGLGTLSVKGTTIPSEKRENILMSIWDNRVQLCQHQDVERDESKEKNVCKR